MSRNPFGDDVPPPRPVGNPFGDEEGEENLDESLRRVEHAARRVRALRSQLGAEGLSPSSSRELLDDIARAFESLARAIRTVSEP